MDSLPHLEPLADGLVDSVAALFAAEETLRRIPRGLEWGRRGARQRLWWEDPVSGRNGGPDLFRIRILTEVAPVAAGDGAVFEGGWEPLLDLGELSLWGGLAFADEMEGHLCLAGALSGHAGNVGYLPRLLFRAMAAQAATREAFYEGDARPFLEVSGVDLADDMRELSESIHLALHAADDEAPHDASADLLFLAKQFENPPCLLCSPDQDGLSAEFPFGEETSLLRIDLEAENPLFGPATAITLLLPIDAERSAPMLLDLLERNRSEQTDHDIPWSLGSWFVDETFSPRLAYQLWLPHALFQRNLLVNFAIGMAARARRCCETIAGMTFEESYPLAMATLTSRMRELLAMMGDGEGEGLGS